MWNDFGLLRKGLVFLLEKIISFIEALKNSPFEEYYEERHGRVDVQKKHENVNGASVRFFFNGQNKQSRCPT